MGWAVESQIPAKGKLKASFVICFVFLALQFMEKYASFQERKIIKMFYLV